MQPETVGGQQGAPAGHIQDHLKQFPADFGNIGFAGGDAPRIEIDQVEPAVAQGGIGRDLDHRCHRQAAGRAAAGGECLKVHARHQLQVPQIKSLAGVAAKA